jgi:hypothetical protein
MGDVVSTAKKAVEKVITTVAAAPVAAQVAVAPLTGPALFAAAGEAAKRLGDQDGHIGINIPKLSPEPPQLPPIPAPPSAQDPAVAANMEKAADAERRNRGRASTILTGGQGLTSESTTAKRRLLGS